MRKIYLLILTIVFVSVNLSLKADEIHITCNQSISGQTFYKNNENDVFVLHFSGESGCSWSWFDENYYTLAQNPDETVTVSSSYSGMISYNQTFSENSYTYIVVFYLEGVEPLNNQNNILSFFVENQTGQSIINVTNNTISINIANGVDLTNLVANFTLSEDATAYIDNIVQVSGITANDFSSPVTYTVEAENGNMQNWVVTFIKIYPQITVSAGINCELNGNDFNLTPNLVPNIKFDFRLSITSDINANVNYNFDFDDQNGLINLNSTPQNLDLYLATNETGYKIFTINGIEYILYYNVEEVSFQFAKQPDDSWNLESNIPSQCGTGSGMWSGECINGNIEYYIYDPDPFATIFFQNEYNEVIKSEFHITDFYGNLLIFSDSIAIINGEVFENYSNSDICEFSQIESLGQNNIVVYPSPTNGIVNIETVEHIQNLRIFDVLGKEIWIKFLENNVVDFSNQKPGTYLMQIKTEKNVYIKKIILE